MVPKMSLRAKTQRKHESETWNRLRFKGFGILLTLGILDMTVLSPNNNNSTANIIPKSARIEPVSSVFSPLTFCESFLSQPGQRLARLHVALRTRYGFRRRNQHY